MQLWRATPAARAHFGRGTVWYTSDKPARQAQSAFGEALADSVGLYVADLEPEHVVYLPSGRSLPSERSMAYADQLIGEAAGQWLALLDGPRPGGPWETWVRLGDEPIEARLVPDPEADKWAIPAGW